MNMLVIIKRRQLSLFVKDDSGMHHRLVFAAMDEGRARRLVREYGFKPRMVYAVMEEEVCYRHRVDDSLVQAVLARMPARERHHYADWLAAVRTIVPQADRIVNVRELYRMVY